MNKLLALIKTDSERLEVIVELLNSGLMSVLLLAIEDYHVSGSFDDEKEAKAAFDLLDRVIDAYENPDSYEVSE